MHTEANNIVPSKKTVSTQRRSFRPGVYENGAKRNIMQVCQVKKSPWFGFKETLKPRLRFQFL